MTSIICVRAEWNIFIVHFSFRSFKDRVPKEFQCTCDFCHKKMRFWELPQQCCLSWQFRRKEFSFRKMFPFKPFFTSHASVEVKDHFFNRLLLSLWVLLTAQVYALVDCNHDFTNAWFLERRMKGIFPFTPQLNFERHLHKKFWSLRKFSRDTLIRDNKKITLALLLSRHKS